MLLVLGEGRVARERKELVCGDTGCDSRVPEARLPGQFFHALGRDFRDVSEDRHQPLFSLGYCDTLSLSDCAHRMLGDAVPLGDVHYCGPWIG